ncbi:MAG: Kazal-type serine protease inhibitor domain-containing protein [Polyangiaceae bacterium]
MTRHLIIWISLLVATGCGGSSNDPAGSAGSGGSAGNGGSAGSGGSGGSAGSSGTAGSGGVAGAATRECQDQGGWCAYTDGTCGATTDCFCQLTRPESCPDVSLPVCGCDGVTYRNACLASQAGTDLHWDDWVCQLGEYQEPCGSVACDVRSSLCQKNYTDRPDPSSYDCYDISGSNCSTCDCITPPEGCECVTPKTGLRFIECHL